MMPETTIESVRYQTPFGRLVLIAQNKENVWCAGIGFILSLWAWRTDVWATIPTLVAVVLSVILTVRSWALPLYSNVRHVCLIALLIGALGLISFIEGYFLPGRVLMMAGTFLTGVLLPVFPRLRPITVPET